MILKYEVQKNPTTDICYLFTRDECVQLGDYPWIYDFPKFLLAGKANGYKLLWIGNGKIEQLDEWNEK